MEQALLLSDKSEVHFWNTATTPPIYMTFKTLQTECQLDSEVPVLVSPLDYTLQCYEKSCFQISCHIYSPFWLKMSFLFYSHDKCKSAS